MYVYQSEGPSLGNQGLSTVLNDSSHLKRFRGVCQDGVSGSLRKVARPHARIEDVFQLFAQGDVGQRSRYADAQRTAAHYSITS